MDKKYIVLDQFDVSDKEYNQVFSTEEEAIEKAESNLQKSHARDKQYVAVVTTLIESDIAPVATTIKSI